MSESERVEKRLSGWCVREEKRECVRVWWVGVCERVRLRVRERERVELRLSEYCERRERV